MVVSEREPLVSKAKWQEFLKSLTPAQRSILMDMANDLA